MDDRPFCQRVSQSSKTSEASRWQLNRIHVSIENPWPSELFSIGEIKDALTALDTIRIKYDCCPYGANYKKRSQLRTTMKALTKLNKLCPHPPGTHESLEGTVTMLEQGRLVTKWRTSLAAQYVPGLCREWADLMCSEAPVQTFTPPGEPARATLADLAYGLHRAYRPVGPPAHLPTHLCMPLGSGCSHLEPRESEWETCR